MATRGSRKAVNGSGAEIASEHIHGRIHGDFDLERSKLSMSPKMFWAIVAGSVGTAVVIAGLLVNTNWRIGGVEQGISDLRVELQEDRERTQTRQQAYIDCLETERTNKGFTCPMAKTARAAEPAPLPARRKVAKKEQPSSGISWPWSPAIAGDSK